MSNDGIDDEEQRQRWDMAHGDAGPLPEEWSRETSAPGTFGSEWDPGMPQTKPEIDELDDVGDDSPQEESTS